MDAEEIKKTKVKWKELTQKLKNQFDEEPDLQVILFLIGVQELGKGVSKFSKDDKQNLMHIATCRVLSSYGYYALDNIDEDGWQHYKVVKPMPPMSLGEQDLLLRNAVIRYFEESGLE
ncbi:hypothetical protein BH11BAC1_BH11BAC1_09930 [soil metagenome]